MVNANMGCKPRLASSLPRPDPTFLALAMMLSPPRPCGRVLEARKWEPKLNVKFKNETAWRLFDDRRMKNRHAAKRKNLKAYRPERLPPAVRVGAVEA